MKTIAALLALIAFSASSFAQVEPTAPIKVAFLHVNDVYQFTAIPAVYAHDRPSRA